MQDNKTLRNFLLLIPILL